MLLAKFDSLWMERESLGVWLFQQPALTPITWPLAAGNPQQ